MKVSIPAYRCPLGRSTERIDPDSIKREGGRDQHILVVSESDDRLDFVERQFVRLLGERLYGEKRRG